MTNILFIYTIQQEYLTVQKLFFETPNFLKVICSIKFLKTLIMTRILITTVLFLIGVYTQAQKNSTAKFHNITVRIKNTYSNHKKVYFALYDKEGFKPHQPIARQNGEIKNGKVTLTFDHLLNGEYAIIGFLDENDNQRLDFNLDTGIPTELYGISNNPTLFGPPQFEDAKFKIEDKNLDLIINLQ